MGATSIRGIIGYIQDGMLQLDEVMRLNHHIIDNNGIKQWDWETLIETIEKTILEHAQEIVSIGIDTWGVDFGLLDESKQLIQAPLSYRDERSQVGYEAVKNEIDFYELFQETGNQIMPINSLFQLKTIALLQPEVLAQAKHLLMTPNLVNYYLTGVLSSERTIGSTSQMFDLKKGDWNRELIEKMGFDASLFPSVIPNKTVIGSTKHGVAASLHNTDIDVISIASHDTASAVAVTEAYFDPNCLFLSSGTWALLGCVTDEPVLTREAFEYHLTNETGYNGRNLFFKNMTGLYLVEKLIREFEEREHKRYSYDAITEIVESARPFQAFLDPEEPRFGMETPSLIRDMEEHLTETGQKVPKNPCDYFASSMKAWFCSIAHWSLTWSK